MTEFYIFLMGTFILFSFVMLFNLLLHPSLKKKYPKYRIRYSRKYELERYLKFLENTNKKEELKIYKELLKNV